jgi:hypothetical protein
MTPDQFARETRTAERSGGGDSDDGIHIVRAVPKHNIAIFTGCTVDDIGEVVRQIGEAIENGAPLYNEGKHEACFRIYEGTVVKYEHDAPCAGVRSAFGDGLLRAAGLATYKEKAWALRDTFDGLIDAARRWAEKNPQSGSPGRPETKPAKPAKPSKPTKPRQ